LILKKGTKLNVYKTEKDSEKKYKEDYKYIRWDGVFKEENYLEKVYVKMGR